MKVREVLRQLGKVDPESEVLIYSEDEDLLTKGRGFVVFDLSAVSETEAERTRLDDGTPYLKLGRSPLSETITILEVTSDS